MLKLKVPERILVLGSWVLQFFLVNAERHSCLSPPPKQPGLSPGVPMELLKRSYIETYRDIQSLACIIALGGDMHVWVQS